MLWPVVGSWITVGIVVPLLIGVGVGVMSMSPPDFLVAKVSFSLAAIILVFRLGWWLAMEHPSGAKSIGTVLFAFLTLGGIGALWITSLIWVDGRRTLISTSLRQTAGTPEQETPAPTRSRPRFRERIERVTIWVGGNAMIQSIERLRQGNVTLLNFNGRDILKACIQNQELYVDVEVPGVTSRSPVQVQHNEFVQPPIGWDRNFDESALEFVDQHQNVRLQLIYLSDHEVVVNEIFSVGNTIVVASKTGMTGVGSKRPMPPSAPPIFMYPSIQHPGERRK